MFLHLESWPKLPQKVRKNLPRLVLSVLMGLPLSPVDQAHERFQSPPVPRVATEQQSTPEAQPPLPQPEWSIILSQLYQEMRTALTNSEAGDFTLFLSYLERTNITDWNLPSGFELTLRLALPSRSEAIAEESEDIPFQVTFPSEIKVRWTENGVEVDDTRINSYLASGESVPEDLHLVENVDQVREFMQSEEFEASFSLGGATRLDQEHLVRYQNINQSLFDHFTDTLVSPDYLASNPAIAPFSPDLLVPSTQNAFENLAEGWIRIIDPEDITEYAGVPVVYSVNVDKDVVTQHIRVGELVILALVQGNDLGPVTQRADAHTLLSDRLGFTLEITDQIGTDTANSGSPRMTAELQEYTTRYGAHGQVAMSAYLDPSISDITIGYPITDTNIMDEIRAVLPQLIDDIAQVNR